MLLNLNDPESILAWWKVWPERHHSFLEYALKASPACAPSILEALRLITLRPELLALSAKLVQARREQEPVDAVSDVDQPRPSYKELLVA